MGRKIKHILGLKIVTISLPHEVVEQIDIKALQYKKSRSELISQVLENTICNNYSYARMQAKKHSREFHFWKAEMDRYEHEKTEGLL